MGQTETKEEVKIEAQYRCLKDEGCFKKDRIYLLDDTFENPTSSWEVATPRPGDRLTAGRIICAVENKPELFPKYHLQILDTNDGERNWFIIPLFKIPYMTDMDPDFSIAHSEQSQGLINQEKDMGVLLMEDKQRRNELEADRVAKAVIVDDLREYQEKNPPNPLTAGDNMRSQKLYALREEVRIDEAALNGKKKKLAQMIRER